MKLEYTTPEITVTLFATEDIITASSVSEGLTNVSNNANAVSYDDIFG